jgi:asparagine synthase (glutamine-hydrolysing)
MDDRTGTMFRFVHRLPAAHTMTVTRTRVRQGKYWEASAARDVRYSTSDQYAAAFREIFGEAVKARLRSAHAVGATLSGGLDSSSVVCMAREIRRGSRHAPLHTFSLVFPSLPEKDLRLIDERRYIEAVVRGGGVAPTWVRGDELSPMADVGETLDELDEPYAAPNLYLHRGLYRAAEQRGARVLLDGFDGDTAVSHGFARLNTLLRRGDWDVFEHEIRAVAAHREMRIETIIGYFGLPYLALLARHGKWIAWARTARELTRRFGLSSRDTLATHGIRPALPLALRTAYRSVRARHNDLPPLGLREDKRTARARQLRDEELDIMNDERESHVHGLSQPAYQLTLEMADKCAAPFGVEPRYPYFDRRLIDFCVGLPDSEKLSDGWPRLVFRRAMEGILPAEIQWRSDKGNLSPNFHRALRASESMRADVSADSPLAGFINLEALQAIRRQYRDETSTLGRSAEGHTIFRIDVLERWLSRRASRECSEKDQEHPQSAEAKPHAPAAA